MSEHIDTREGWQELDVVTPESIYQLAEYDPNDGSVVRAWVRVSPVPPLPTEPYTVIRAALPNGTSDVFIRNELGWYLLGEMEAPVHPLNFTGFEVLAEPRAVTAKAVLEEATEFLDRAWQPGHMRVLSYDLQTALFAHIRDRFGVSS